MVVRWVVSMVKSASTVVLAEKKRILRAPSNNTAHSLGEKKGEKK